MTPRFFAQPRYVDIAPAADAADVGCRMRAEVKKHVGEMGQFYIRCRSGAWSLILSADVMVGTIFSARLIDTSHSTEADWHHLGMLVAAVGAPPKMPESIASAPEASHKWFWNDEDLLRNLPPTPRSLLS